jgi:hypothetical protein
LSALNLAGTAGFAIPVHAAGAGVGIAVQIVTTIAMELKGRSQSVKPRVVRWCAIPLANSLNQVERVPKKAQ